jgi:DNA end-binding protein Ku
VLSVMRFADELVDASQFDFPGVEGVRKAELDMAKALVNSLAAEWDPSKYTDQYRENLLRIIQGKVKGKAVDLEPVTEPRQADVVDLMERLRRSLAQTGGAKASKARKAAGKTVAKKRGRRHAA